jgi:membrane protein DedA with SNARE-associated domain
VIDVLGVLAASPSPQPLPPSLHRFEPTLHHWGYLAVGVSLFAENIGVPLPGQLVLIAAALYAGTGHLSIVAVGVVGLAATIAGSAAGYLVGVYGGRPLVERYGKFVLLTGERMEKAERFFNERGWLVLLLGRFVEGVRQAAAIIAGISEMTFKRFMIFTSLGAVIWIAFWTALSDTAGNHVTTIIKYAAYIAGALGLVVLALVVRFVIRARRRRR